MSNIAAIQNRAKELNYNRKKTDASRNMVVALLAEEFELPEGNIIAAILAEVEEIKQEAVKVEKPVKIDTRPVEAGRIEPSEEARKTLRGRKFIVTSAQNNTPSHGDFLAALETFAAHNDAQIVIFPFLYNKNGFQNGEGQENVYYSADLTKYLQHESVWLGEGKKVAALAFNILPTVKNPLASMREAVGCAEAMILPHATIAHECVPVLGAQQGRTVPGMYSTGTVTQRNYIQQQAGHKAENRHNFGAVVVEFNDFGQFWIRQIETDHTGKFQDLTNIYWPDGEVAENRDASAISWGDIHAEQIDQRHAMMQFGGIDSMVDYFQPAYQFMHDLLDFKALNHHNRENHYHIAKNAVSGDSVEKDLCEVLDVLEMARRDYCQTVIVRSNHDDALDRWLADSKYEPRKDATNALLYFRLQVASYTAINEGREIDVLPVALQFASNNDESTLIANCQFLKASQSFIVKGVEFGEHGHSGTNGSRGSPKQFSGAKMVTGHTHTSSIYGGCYTGGVTGKLAMGYNETGASSWVHAHVVQYSTGFRTIIHVKDDGTGDLAFKA